MNLNLEQDLRGEKPIRGGMLPREDFELFWPEMCEGLDKVRDTWETYWTKEALYNGVDSGRFQVWGFGPEGCVNVIVFTEIAEFPANKIFRLFLAFGNSLDKVLPVMEAILMRFAQESGCTVCEVLGRVGWERKIPRLKREVVVLRCDVEKKRIH